LEAKVISFIRPVGSCDLPKFHYVPSHIYDIILTLVPPVITNFENVLAWKFNADGDLSLSSAYQVAFRDMVQSDSILKLIWRNLVDTDL